MTNDTNGYVSLIRGPSGEQLIVLRLEDFQRLLRQAGDADDELLKGYRKLIAAFDNHIEPTSTQPGIGDDEAIYDKAMSQLEHGEDELIPSAVADRLIDGESPVRVWRDYRGLTQKQLSEKSNVKQSAISMIERGRRQGNIETLKSLANALGVLVDDLVA